MSIIRKVLIALLVLIVIAAGAIWWMLRGSPGEHTLAELSGPKPVLVRPNEQTIPTIGTAKPLPWKAGETPVAAAGLTVKAFAAGLAHPRNVITLPNGDVLVSEASGPKSEAHGITGFVMKLLLKRVGSEVPSANRIALLRDADGDGVADLHTTLIGGLNSPFGLAWQKDTLYIANTDGVVSVPYVLGETAIAAAPVKVVPLPPAGRHWVKNLLLSPDGTKLYVTVGSGSDHAENGIKSEAGRAAIWEYSIADKHMRQFAGGLRNPNGMAWNAASGELWTVVNERDQLGSDLVPDYLTNVPLGVNYGWPWVYYKDVIDWRVKDPIPGDFMEYIRKPEYALGAHVAALGLAFNQPGSQFAAMGDGAFIARHGSWNRKPLSGYDVVFVKFDKNGNPLADKPVTVLSGFLTADQKNAHGRPVMLSWAKDGALLLADDVGGVVWRITGSPAPILKPARVAAR